MKHLALLFISTCMILFTSCKNFEEIKVTSVDSFAISKMSLEGIDAEIKVKIMNPNSIGFSIYPSNFDVIYSGIKLGKAKLNKRVHINAKTESAYTFKLTSALGELNLFDAMQLLNSNKVGKIEINGDLKVGKLFIKKKFPINFSEKVPMLK